MATAQLEQAWLTRAADGSPIWDAHSPGWQPAWTEPTAALLRAWGPPAAPTSIWAQPLGRTHVIVGQLAGPRGRLLVLTNALYASITDPFWLADQFPLTAPSGDCLTLNLAVGPPDWTIAGLQHLLQHGNGPLWLAATQALVDGGRLAFARPAGDVDLCRAIWHLLPYNTRVEVWPATFAPTNELGFQLVVLPTVVAGDPQLVGYWTEEAVLNYPESPYELRLQQAIEAGDAHTVAGLFQRRSGRQTMRLAAWLLGGAIVVGTLMKFLSQR